MRGALAALLAASLVLAGCSGDGSEPAGSPSADPDAPEVTELDAGPVGVAEVDGEAWTTLVRDGAVRTADDLRIDVGEFPLRLVDTPSGVWVSVIGDGTVVQIDSGTGEVLQTVPIKPTGSEPEGIAWDGESLWVVDQAGGRVLQLDGDGTKVTSYSTDTEPRLVAVGESGVWVANYGGSSVTRIAGGRVETAKLPGCTGPQGIAESAGKVWISCTLSGKVVVLNAGTMKQVGEIPDVPDADAVVAGDDSVYVVGQSGPTVYVVDPKTAEVADTVVLDDAPPTSENVGAAVVGADLVVTHPDVRKIYTVPLP
ncbi:hypothetical protein [Nocardioides sp. SR21]|uniref:Vgb family protein n=1 Tax=Nocardioides sp. SR21 TaxID=2919501 RepID=UPI001FAAA23A|nr:hypothetical protein [Nocardioides sp. SR21]